jgi:putative oxygen-independent coproporphyrinogen III oxidase
MTSAPVSAYIHIPFCRRRCFYCDFPISVLGNRRRGETSNTMEAYVDWVCREIAATPSQGQPLQTVFFGGGTPSLLSVAQLKRLLHQLDHCFGIVPDAEISMEMDPGTFTLDHLQGYLAAGVNRISLGVQAFEEELLAQCGRFHHVADVYQAVEWLHQVEMPNWSLDLISGLPEQTVSRWQQGLVKAVALEPHHLSVYDLTVEPQTVFGKRYQPGVSPLPTEAQTSDMYRLAQGYLTGLGYDHYEISNYARPGHRCRHNLTYWRNQPYYGFGMGATSYTRHQRCDRPRTLSTYRQWVEAFTASGGVLHTPATPLTEQLLDRLIVGLRLQAGIPGSELRDLCCPSLWETLYRQLAPYLAKGWLVIEVKPDKIRQEIPTYKPDKVPPLEDIQCLRLTDPEGFLFSNVVLVTCFELLADFVAME